MGKVRLYQYLLSQSMPIKRNKRNVMLILTHITEMAQCRARISRRKHEARESVPLLNRGVWGAGRKEGHGIVSILSDVKMETEKRSLAANEINPHKIKYS